MTPGSVSLPAGESRTFTGTVSLDGQPLPNVALKVSQRVGTAWQVVTTVTTDSAGAWSFTVRPVAATTWRAEFVASGGRPGGVSAPFSAAIVQVPAQARVDSATSYLSGRRTWAAWALHDQLTGRWYGNKVNEVNNTESMIKVWLAADLLLGIQKQGRGTLTEYERSLIGRMIRYSDDQAAETIYRARGSDAVIQRLISICGLTDTYIGKPHRWSWTKISPRDAIRMGLCVLPGRKLWTPLGNYLLGEMRNVAPSNAFGIQAAYPAGDGVRIAVKNGWTAQGALSSWLINCLGIWGPNNRWLLVIETKSPVQFGQAYGATTCQEVTRRLFR